MTPVLLAVLLAIAACTTAYSWHHAFSKPNPAMGVLYASVAMVLWGIFAYSSLAVDINVDNNNDIVTTAYEPLAMVGLLGMVVVAPLIYKGGLELIDGRGTGFAGRVS